VARKPGPAPFSADVIELTGNRSKLSAEELEARREKEVKARPLHLDPPGHLSPYARECWEQHAPELAALGLLTVLDRGSFELACECYSLAREALEEMRPRKADGTADGRSNRRRPIDVDLGHAGNLRKHPAFTVFNMAQNSYKSWAIEFGLTPSARVSLRPGAGGAVGDGESRDDDDDFFGTG
jgi:P27 family predicted phage terminase small subunit